MAKDFEETVLNKLDELQGDVSGLKADVGELKGLKADVRRLEVLHEATEEKLDQIIEILSPEMERTSAHSQRLDDHETRISLLEKAV